MSPTAQAVAGTPTRVPAAVVEPRLSTAARTALEWGLPLEHDLSSPSTARREARRVMNSWGAEGEILNYALLVVSELVTNAVQYALPPISLSLHSPTIRLCSSMYPTAVLPLSATDGP
ncbi:ATP-binding protein [Streptomyces sp. NPDC020951]|uniref:ATP-binding protein n=1 Tax=Streptomyces sp. NPDC020951 TaxID=3365104 RepID=UPI0037934932